MFASLCSLCRSDICENQDAFCLSLGVHIQSLLNSVFVCALDFISTALGAPLLSVCPLHLLAVNQQPFIKLPGVSPLSSRQVSSKHEVSIFCRSEMPNVHPLSGKRRYLLEKAFCLSLEGIKSWPWDNSAEIFRGFRQPFILS